MLSTTCRYCGTDRKFKNLVFNSALEAACSSPMKCSTVHPNSLDNIRRRGTVEEFYTYEEAMQIAHERTEQTYRHSVSSHSRRLRSINIDSLLNKAISFRVANEMQADYIAYLMGKLSINKLSQVMHYLINSHLDKDTGFIAEYTARQTIAQYAERNAPTQKRTAPQAVAPVQPVAPQPTFNDEDVFEI